MSALLCLRSTSVGRSCGNSPPRPRRLRAPHKPLQGHTTPLCVCFGGGTELKQLQIQVESRKRHAKGPFPLME